MRFPGGILSFPVVIVETIMPYLFNIYLLFCQIL